MKKIEILAPAGNLEILKAVVMAGCDAVYFGGELFGARAYAKNFTKEEVETAISYTQFHGKDSFLTINTVLKNREIEEQLFYYLLPFYERGLTAVIVQDFGVMQFIRDQFIGLDIHCSTQMSISNAKGAAFMKEHGASRVVTSRELSLFEIQQIHEQVDVEIETFVHGALCYGYSGKCLFSSLLGGRSGNRGRCAQPCRLPYETFDANGKICSHANESYPLSLKDLSTLLYLPQMVESGIYSFKIEGRMKQAQYAAGVVSMYRKYVDQYLQHKKEGYKVTKEDLQALSDFGNRSGFTSGYLFEKNDASMVTLLEPSHKKIDNLEKRKEEQIQLEAWDKINITGVAKFVPGKNCMLKVSYKNFVVEATGEEVLVAQKRPLTKEDAFEKLNKTGNTPFVFEQLHITVEEGGFLPVTKLNELRRSALSLLEEEIKKVHQREPVEKTTDLLNKVFSKPKKNPQIVVTIQELNQLEPIIQCKEIGLIYLDASLVEQLEQTQLFEVFRIIEQKEKKIGVILSPVLREDGVEFWKDIVKEKPNLYYLASNFDALSFLIELNVEKEKIRLDQGLYTYSNVAHNAYYRETGIDQDTVPFELNKKELVHRDCTHSELVIYGFLPLMISASCVKKTIKGCDHQGSLLYLKDRYQTNFPVKNNCRLCYNVIYNALPLCLFDVIAEVKKLQCESLRLAFTIESTQQVEKIIHVFEKKYIENEEIATSTVLSEFTFGHWKRGVE